jgi:predicted transcriptional regulator
MSWEIHEVDACMTACLCYHDSMIRTQIQLDDDVYGQLRQFAMHRRRSMAACIRDAIGLFLGHAESAHDDLSDVAGKFRPLPTDEVKAHDRVWAESALDGRRAT